MNETVVGIMAVRAQAERPAISDRTRAAVQAANCRGVKLGNPNLQPGTAQRAAKARAEELRDTVEAARKAGAVSLRQLADHLNELGVSAPRSGQWYPASVSGLLPQLAT